MYNFEELLNHINKPHIDVIVEFDVGPLLLIFTPKKKWKEKSMQTISVISLCNQLVLQPRQHVSIWISLDTFWYYQVSWFLGINHYTTWYASKNKTNIIGVLLDDSIADSSAITLIRMSLITLLTNYMIHSTDHYIWLYIVSKKSLEEMVRTLKDTKRINYQ
uniref:Uncharacterized protein n=1 Tax=Solanum lycopersicum TaxID=4081 RepID=A0A3Q7ETF5_SOLLC